jgi:hypothetical protein
MRAILEHLRGKKVGSVIPALASLLATLPGPKSGIFHGKGPRSILLLDCPTGLGKHGRPLAYGELRAQGYAVKKESPMPAEHPPPPSGPGQGRAQGSYR